MQSEQRWGNESKSSTASEGWWHHATRSQLCGRESSFKQNKTVEKYWFYISKKEAEWDAYARNLRSLASSCSTGDIKIIYLEAVIHGVLILLGRDSYWRKHKSCMSLNRRNRKSTQATTATIAEETLRTMEKRDKWAKIQLIQKSSILPQL